MAHLGADVAAFVDDQLPAEQTAAVRRHLQECERCRQAVFDEQHLKRRMGATGPPVVPAELTRSLSRLASVPATTMGLPAGSSRGRRHLGSVAVVVGASFAILLLAYLVGQEERLDGDPVQPAFDDHAAAFIADTATDRSPDVASATMATTGFVLSAKRLEQLSADGWPCHDELAGGFNRVDGRVLEGSDAVVLRYADASDRVRVHLVQQRGALDRAALDGFRPVVTHGSKVWLREGVPTVVTWDTDGLVFTLVADVGWDRIDQAVTDLPGRPAADDLIDRLDDGLQRMTSWVAVN